MDQPIKIQVYDQETKAAIKEIKPDCTVDAVREALKDEYIRNGINWEKIEQSIDNARSTGKTLCNITIAISRKLPLSIQYGHNGAIISGSEIESFRRNLQAIGSALRNKDSGIKLSGGIFVRSGEVALTVHINETFVNVYGENVHLDEKEKPYAKEKCLSVKPTPEGYQLISLASGFLIINEHGVFDIYNPFYASDDRQTLYSHLIPLAWGRQTFIDKVISSTPPTPSETTVNHLDDIAMFFDGDTLSSIDLRHGTPPTPGRPGSIRFLLQPDSQHPEHKGDRVDYRAISTFREIDAGTVIAERVPMIQSSPGIDVFGEPIRIAKVKDYIFSYGDGVAEEYTPDLITYRAKERGVLQLDEHFVNVSPVLIVNGDVCSETGSITFSRSVIIHGTVRSGFNVTCGDLTIRENIEDATKITCKGNLIVQKGIFGERTKVFVEKDAKIGRIQNAYLRINGECLIDEYAYHAKIFCRKDIRVEGRGRIDKRKGCVIGGELCGLETIAVHSIGSAATLTTVTCGFDSEHLETLKKTQALESTLKKKVLLLQNKVDLKSFDKDTLALKIKYFSSEKRQLLKTTLEDLRTTIAQMEKAGASIALLTRKTMSSDLCGSKILIQKHLIPQVLAVFPHAKKKIYREYSHILISYNDDEIQIADSFSDK